MGTIAKQGAGFETELPPTGPHRAVCVDEHYLGYITGEWQGQPTNQEKVLLVWELDPATAGEHSYFENWYRIQCRHTLSLSDNANLYKDLVAWRGKKFTSEELAGFDLGAVLGAPALINVIHSEDGKWANIGSIMPNMPGTEPLQPSGKYVRIKDRSPKETEPQLGSPPVESYDRASTTADELEDEELPF